MGVMAENGYERGFLVVSKLKSVHMFDRHEYYIANPWPPWSRLIIGEIKAKSISFPRNDIQHTIPRTTQFFQLVWASDEIKVAKTHGFSAP